MDGEMFVGCKLNRKAVPTREMDAPFAGASMLQRINFWLSQRKVREFFVTQDWNGGIYLVLSLTSGAKKTISFSDVASLAKHKKMWGRFTGIMLGLGQGADYEPGIHVIRRIPLRSDGISCTHPTRGKDRSWHHGSCPKGL